MNRKNTLIVVFIIFGALVVSAFSLVAINNENNAASLQRGRAADAARYTAMAEYYLAKDGASLQRGREADAARYTAMAEYYLAKDGASLQRGRAADAARYTAMAKFYAGQASLAANLSWPARPDFSVLNETVDMPAFHYTSPGR